MNYPATVLQRGDIAEGLMNYPVTVLQRGYIPEGLMNYPATVLQRADIPEGLMNYPVYCNEQRREILNKIPECTTKILLTCKGKKWKKKTEK
jgi:hypothetical protein